MISQVCRRHRVPWQSRPQGCRIPDIGERFGAQRSLAYGDLSGRQTDPRWPAQARSLNALQWFSTAACVRGGGGLLELGFGCCYWLGCSKRSVARCVVRMGSSRVTALWQCASCNALLGIGHAQQPRDDGPQLGAELIEPPQSCHGGLFGPTRIMEIGLHQLHVGVWSGVSDFDKHTTSGLRQTSFTSTNFPTG